MSADPVDPAYRHIAKVAVARPTLILGDARLKCYALAPVDKPVPDAVTGSARDYLRQAHVDGAIDLADDRGFVILHRCGESFYFLLVSVWRGSNELWEAVYYWDAGMTAFELFDPAYPAKGPRPTFCVWELGIVAAEAAAWARLLSSPREADDEREWQASLFAGEV